MFINLSNHPSSEWGDLQLNAAHKCGDILDVPFPAVDPNLSGVEVEDLASDYFNRIERLSDEMKISMCDLTVMVEDEFTFTYHIVGLLKSAGCHVVSACTKREAIEKKNDDGSNVKTAVFRFVQFRSY